MRVPVTSRGRRPTIGNVAEAAGLSVATVDRVLNRRAPVTPQTAQRVLEAAQRLGFHATSLVRKRLDERLEERTLGFLLQRHSESFYKGLAAELTRATRASIEIRGRVAIEFLDDLAPARVADALQRLAQRSDAVGVVAADHPRIAEAVDRITAAGKPVFMLLSDITAPARTGCLSIDHRKAGRTAAWAISRLAQAPGPVGVMIGNHRYLGHELCEMSFRSYFREHAPDFRLLDAVMCLEDPRLAHEATLDLLAHVRDLCGLYVAGGGMEGVIDALREHGHYRSIIVVCNELIPETRAALIDGVVDVVIATPSALLADRAVDAMTRALDGRDDIDGRSMLPFGLHTAENI